MTYQSGSSSKPLPTGELRGFGGAGDERRNSDSKFPDESGIGKQKQASKKEIKEVPQGHITKKSRRNNREGLIHR